MTTEHKKLLVNLEGLRLWAYDCTAGKRTIGVGFNMEQRGARRIWNELGIETNFDRAFNRTAHINTWESDKLLEYIWKKCIKKAKKRATRLGLDYDKMPPYKQFILTDIAYNTGSVKKWKKVFLATDPKDVLYEARRNPKPILDNRVSKIGYEFKIIKSITDAKQLGLRYARRLT